MKKTILILLALGVALLCGCTVSHGIFSGMSQNATDTTLSASYLSFDGSLAKRVALEQGDVLTFSLSGGEDLPASVRLDGLSVCEITDGAAFTAPEKGTYELTLAGKAQNGSFLLSWKISPLSSRPAPEAP